MQNGKKMMMPDMPMKTMPMKGMGDMAGKMRTPSGAPSAEAREKSGDKEGRFPIFDAKSAASALKLRGHAKDKAERKSIIRRAMKYQPEAAKEAFKADKKAGLID